MAERHAYLRRARHWIANRGWRGFFDELWYRLRFVLRGQPLPGRENGNLQPHPFDVAHGVDTGGLVWGEALERPQDQAAAYWATGYYGISPSAFTAALQRLRLPWSQYTFVDIGCGKGRAVLLAMRLPFQRILGIELSPALAAVAEANVQRFHAEWQQPVPTTILTADATTVALPRGPLAIFLYHPFAAPVMRRFLLHLAEAAREQQRAIVLLYANPELSNLVLQTPGCEWLWRETFDLTPEEGAADRFGSHGEIFAAFRFTAA